MLPCRTTAFRASYKSEQPLRRPARLHSQTFEHTSELTLQSQPKSLSKAVRASGQSNFAKEYKIGFLPISASNDVEPTSKQALCRLSESKGGLVVAPPHEKMPRNLARRKISEPPESATASLESRFKENPMLRTHLHPWHLVKTVPVRLSARLNFVAETARAVSKRIELPKRRGRDARSAPRYARGPTHSIDKIVSLRRGPKRNVERRKRVPGNQILHRIGVPFWKVCQ